jgi:hypothetical protein
MVSAANPAASVENFFILSIPAYRYHKIIYSNDIHLIIENMNTSARVSGHVVSERGGLGFIFLCVWI